MWAMHHNPRDFPDSDTLRPERFLNGLERLYSNSKGSNPSGWGRRGQKVKVDIFAYIKSENMRPKKIKARFLPCLEKIREGILNETAVAREALKVYDGETEVMREDVASYFTCSSFKANCGLTIQSPGITCCQSTSQTILEFKLQE
ncbi:hypothetical protein GQ44DRAFT_819093 [Phaeosphaeriaceae sp. PMI808]|nr:hypothetical protein GQ44DRAFT_819093 [Phaeosphaeriaceae sp. PMI808]